MAAPESSPPPAEEEGEDAVDDDVEAQVALTASSKRDAQAAYAQARRRLSDVDMFWSQKLMMAIDVLQIYALLWSMSQPWPWPYTWLRSTRWTLIANLDILGLSPGGAGMGSTAVRTSVWGERPHYLRYAAAFALIPAAIALLWAARGPLAAPRAGPSRCWRVQRFFQTRGRIALEAMLLVSADLLLLPVGLAISRIFICEGGVLMVDPAEHCGAGRQLALAAVLGSGFCVGALLFAGKLWTLAQRAIAYDYAQDHEKHLQLLELDHALLSAATTGAATSDHRAAHAWLVASYRRHAAHHRLSTSTLKLTLLAVFAALRFRPRAQALLFWGVLTPWTAWVAALRRPYRCASSNALATIWFGALSFGMLTGYGVRSSALVASAQAYWLGLIAAAAACASAVLILLVAISRKRATRALSRGRLLGAHQWPSAPTLAAIMWDERRRGWVTTIRSARESLVLWRALPPELVPMQDIEAAMGALWAQWGEAKAADSLLEHPLREALEDMAELHERTRPASIMPGPQGVLAQALADGGVRHAFRARRMQQAHPPV
ncbi:hypothetical protein JKP88DRAFT_279971 [Tribonema minus]|uniref:Uncharacterized protein n=1 Tax=Tribonema minus TaxID=303371 RepID=A0A835YV13_9STRA|nr:hypothetical protein JKP88DRAFT_279971 [Tribonema minus]